jgi:hypothetical protein
LLIGFVQRSRAVGQLDAEPVATLNQQKTEVSLKFASLPGAGVTLDTKGVEGLIETLAGMRAAMNPPRPMEDPAEGTKINVATPGRWWRLQPDGNGVDLDILHPGYGWVGVELDRASVEELSRALSHSVRPLATSTKHRARRE